MPQKILVGSGQTIIIGRIGPAGPPGPSGPSGDLSFVSGMKVAGIPFAGDPPEISKESLESNLSGLARIVNTDAYLGRTIFVGGVDPSVSYSPEDGDVWIEVPTDA